MFSKSSFGLSTVVVILGITASLVLTSSAQKEIKCQGQAIDLKKYFGEWMGCAEKHMPAEDVKKFKDPNVSADDKKALGKKAHENMCITVCVWKGNHLLTADNKLNETSVNGLVTDSSFPEAAREPMKTGFIKCYNDNSNGLSEDNNCKSYDAMHNCINKVFMEVCKADQGMDME